MKKLTAVISAISLAAALTVGSSAATLGDVNGDGKINSADALYVLQYSVGMSVKNFNKAAADINGDGKINSADALKILRITVGIEAATDSASKSEIVKSYNDALNKTYSQLKEATVTMSETGTCTVNGETGIIDPTPYSVTSAFDNGFDAAGLPAYTYGPGTSLTADMIASASTTKLANKTKVKLVLKSEKVDVKKEPVYNAAGGFPFVYSYYGAEIIYFTSGSVTYSGTVIEAVIDSKGRVSELSVTTPYNSEFKMKQNYGKTDIITEKGEALYLGVFSF